MAETHTYRLQARESSTMTFLSGMRVMTPTVRRYIESQKDPDYLNKMGIGIPTIASLSKDGIAEFRSVSLNTKGQEEGLVATYTLEGHGGWILPAEHPDSRYVFNVDDATPEITDMKTGVWAIVKNAKQYTKEKVDKKLSKIFARKLSAGYHIQLRETVSDTFEGVRRAR